MFCQLNYQDCRDAYGEYVGKNQKDRFNMERPCECLNTIYDQYKKFYNKYKHDGDNVKGTDHRNRRPQIIRQAKKARFHLNDKYGCSFPEKDTLDPALGQ